MSYNVLGGLQVARPATTSPEYMDLQTEALNTMGKDLGLKEEKQEGEFPILGSNFEDILKEYNKDSRRHQLEIWEREDSAYQRAANDARKAGIDPNLVGLEPAQTTSTYQNSIDTELGSTFDTLLKSMQQEFEKVENDQKQENDLLGKFLVGAVTILAAVIMKKK